jgi:hypothetical protein
VLLLHGGRFDRSGQRLFRSSGRSATTTSDRRAPCPAGDYSDWPARYSDERIGRGFPRTPRRRACQCGTPGLPSGRGGIRTCQSCPPRPDGWCLLHRPGHFDRAGRKHASAAPSCTVLNSTNSLPVLTSKACAFLVISQCGQAPLHSTGTKENLDGSVSDGGGSTAGIDIIGLPYLAN